MNAKKEHINSNEPVTKGNLEQLREDLQVDMVDMAGELRQEMRETADGLRGEMKGTTDGLRQEMRDAVEELKHHFDAAVENIHNDLTGANRDEISLMQNKIETHDEDIALIKKHVGINS